MEAKDYCRNLEMEMTAWKAKMYDAVRKMDRLPTGDKDKVYEHINGLNILVTELEDRIDQLHSDCPTDWNPQAEDIKVKMGELKSRYNDASKVLFDYEFGG